MADKKTSQETAASALDGTELVRIVQGGSNAKATVSQFKNPITVDFLTLTQLTVDHAVIEGQVYKYVDATYLPASIDHILLTGSGTQTYNNIGQAYVTAIGKYVQCDYDLASNEIICNPKIKIAIIGDMTTSALTVKVLESDYLNVVATAAYSDFSSNLFDALVTFSAPILDSNTLVEGSPFFNSDQNACVSNGQIGSTTILQCRGWNIETNANSEITTTKYLIITVINPL